MTYESRKRLTILLKIWKIEIIDILDEAATAKNTDIQFYVSLSTRLKATCPENESDWNDSTWELYDQAFAAISTAEQQNILK